MKIILSLTILGLLIFGCKQKSETSADSTHNTLMATETTNVPTTAQKIAEASGIDQWHKVSEITFTFNVDRGANHFERSWSWKPKSNEVSLISEKDTPSYNRSQMDSLHLKTDAAFINDKYWLLAPFQLVWDKGITMTEEQNAIAPISKDTLHQLTIVYPDQGGYTPGDAYDFFYDENHKIREWNYRKSNAQTPTMSTTWEDYQSFNGIEIATTHRDSTGNFKLYFTNISVKTETDN